MNSAFRLHHVGILVEDIPRAAEQLKARFGYTIESPIIEDARQTAFVQFLKLPGADHWTELVSPNGPNSVLSSGLRRGNGGTHHLCYEVKDLDAAFTRLRETEMMAVAAPVPATAFSGRRIAWLVDRHRLLIELVEAGPGAFTLPPQDA
jgi:catechol 2,3-dioxygenase-like lactoylglutathione lyase family enzyme